MATSSEQRRAYSGPVIFSHGFRVFFLSAGAWAAVSMLIWVIAISTGGILEIDVDWHMHEMVFGYTTAVIAGFLLTAVPNWTGRMPVVGWPVAGLAAIWLAGRIAMLLPWAAGAIVDVSFLVILAVVIAREVIAGKNWKNMPVLALVMLLAVANGVFHYEALSGGAYRGYGVRAGVGVIIFLISLIGGRVIPSFTRNWLAKRGGGRLPVAFNNYDKVTLLVSGVFILLWIAKPEFGPLQGVAIIVGILHLVRLARWAGDRTFAEPLLTILHVGYVFIPVGYLMIGRGAGVPHAWTAGAVGVMTLAIMTRASLGHSGRALTASRAISAIYIMVLIAVITRILAELFPGSVSLLHLSATAWILGFAGFVAVYFPLLTRKNP